MYNVQLLFIAVALRKVDCRSMRLELLDASLIIIVYAHKEIVPIWSIIIKNRVLKKKNNC